MSNFLRTIAFLLFAIGCSDAAPILAKVYSISGLVESWSAQGNSYTQIKAGQILAVGTVVRTGDDGQAVIVMTPGVRLN